MVARVRTVAFSGIDVLDVDVQVLIAAGMPSFQIVGLPNKAVDESKERIRAAFNALGLALPPKRITVNLSPADLAKEGSHYDLPIALGLLVALAAVSAEDIAEHVVVGELSLDGRIEPVSGVLPAAIHAHANNAGIICPAAQGGEAAWAGDGLSIVAPDNLLTLINHLKGTQVLSRPSLPVRDAISQTLRHDLADVKGQETARRALEIAAAGGHNLLMIGPPGAGKSMLASRLPGLLPELSAEESLELSMIHSVAGKLEEGRILRARPYRDPHHSASLPSLVGGGLKARPGEISLAHHGVLFLDELPEFQRNTLEALRQPMETRRVTISRANAIVTYPASFQLVAAMNPCRCGYLDNPALGCGRAPKCAGEYQSKISGPLFDRIDLHVDVPAVAPHDLAQQARGESSATVAARVAAARSVQQQRYAGTGCTTNAQADGRLLEEVAHLDESSQSLLRHAATHLHLSARGWHRMVRVARTIADLAGDTMICAPHMAEALSYRRVINRTE